MAATEKQASSKIDLKKCREYLELLQTNEYVARLNLGEENPDDRRPDFDEDTKKLVMLAEEKAKKTGNIHIVINYVNEIRKLPLGKRIFAESDTQPETAPARKQALSDFVPPLPPEIAVNKELASKASPLLDAIIEFFKKWCTRSYEGYHETVGIWVLSTIAARRVYLPWRQGVWTPIYVMLVSASTAHAKTEASSYGGKILEDCGLGFLLHPDEITPQKMLKNMAGGELPKNWETMSEGDRDRFLQKEAFSGQRGWIYDEFGNKLQEIVQARGYMAIMYALLKQLYDCKKKFEYDTMSGDNRYIEMPYLSICGTATPACLKPIAQKNSAVWFDGFFARIAFSVPEIDSVKLQSAPNEPCEVPRRIIDALREWHEQLGIPLCKVEPINAKSDEDDDNDDDGDKKDAAILGYRIVKDSLPQNPIRMEQDVHKAHEQYYAALATMANEYNLDERYRSNYGRLPDLALRIAMILASLENAGKMDMRHWHRGLSITEQWRRDFHRLISQILEDDTSNYSETEQKVIDVLIKLGDGKHSAREVSQGGSTALRRMGAPKVRELLNELAATGIIVSEGHGKSAKYWLKEED